MGERKDLARLTEREKECLRLWLRHKTAKEIALDLGISHHAVEKRLKMARTKLGVSSSLEAARILGEAEGYGQAVAQPPDLAEAAAPGHSWSTRSLTLGVTMMSLIAAIALGFTMQGTSEAPRTVDTSVYEEAAANPGERRSIQELEFVKASPERVEAYVRRMFDGWDIDASGFVELAEAPAWLSVPTGLPPADGDEPVYEELEGDAARAQYIANVDKDGDGKVSFEEFAQPVRPQYLERGIPLIPADWTPAGPGAEREG